MKTSTRIRITNINRGLFIFCLCIGIIMTLYGFNGLDTSADAQSRIAFHWNVLSTIVLFLLLLGSLFLYKKWQRIFPYNMPLFLLLSGCYYVMFFVTFTVGWIRMLGFVGLVVFFFTGTLWALIYFSLFLLTRGR